MLKTHCFVPRFMVAEKSLHLHFDAQYKLFVIFLIITFIKVVQASYCKLKGSTLDTLLLQIEYVMNNCFEMSDT